MCTCKHICLCLYSFVYVLSFVKQQMRKNSETVSMVASGRATAYQAGQPSVLRLCDCSHTRSWWLDTRRSGHSSPSFRLSYILLSIHPCANYRAAQRWRPMVLTARRSSYQTIFAKNDQEFPISMFQCRSVNVGLTVLVQAWSSDGYKNPRSKVRLHNLHIFSDSQVIILVAVVKR